MAEEFVIQYNDPDGGMFVHCFEYESLTALKNDFEKFVMRNALALYSHPNQIYRLPYFWGNKVDIQEMVTYKGAEATYNPPVIMPLAEWFKFRYEQGLTENRSK